MMKYWKPPIALLVFRVFAALRLAVATDYSDAANLHLDCLKSTYLESFTQELKSNFIFEGSDFATLSAATMLSCLTYCTKESSCLSINYWKNTKVCQLNNAAASTTGDFTYSLGTVYRQVEATNTKNSMRSCKDFPCLHGGTCYETCDGYSCECADSTHDPDQDCLRDCNSPGLPNTDRDYIQLETQVSANYPARHGTVVSNVYQCRSSWYEITGTNSLECNDGSWTTSISTSPCTLKACSSSAVGVESRSLPDNYLSASSSYDANHGTRYGRLNWGGCAGWGYWCCYCWASGSSSWGQYYQVYFGNDRLVKYLITQGRGDADQWVTGYKVYYYAAFASKWQWLRSSWHSSEKSFSANSNRNSHIWQDMVSMNLHFVATYVRFYPYGWYSHMSMRVEIYACS